jgi:transcriptional regulator GlxA family with amidase domain
MSPKPPQILQIAPQRVVVLAFPDVQLLDVAGLVQVFAAANDQGAKPHTPSPYKIRVVAPEGARARATAGLAFVTEPLPDPDEPRDTLIVAGGVSPQDYRQRFGG